MKFEDVDKHVNAQALPVGAPNAAQLCAYWQAAKPIIQLAVSLPIVPQKWQTVLNGLIGVLNTMCP